jgi:alkylation response protein AidB-like acyl-CoA dehydrogenase
MAPTSVYSTLATERTEPLPMGLTDEQRVLVEAVRDFARSELVEKDRAWDAAEQSCCPHLGPLYELGLMSLRIPEEFGGMACPMLPYAHIIRELAWASPSVAVTVGVHNMVAEAIRMYATPAVRAEILPRLAESGNLAGFAISEPNAGSDASAVRTRAERVAGGWKLSGSKMWVTNGMTARWYITMARTSETGTHKDLSMLLLDATQPAVKRALIHGKMGIRASETCDVALDGAFAQEQHLLGEPGWGMRIGLSALDGGRIGIASQAIGIGSAACDLMTAYAAQREVFGRRIADFQAIQWMIADSHAELMAAQALVDQAAELKDAGRPFTREAAMAKLMASEAANRVAYRAVQSHGGYGFVREFRVEQLYRDARITTIYEGTSEIQRHVIARELLR